jgi:predicted phage terminase large subunit-like protein
MSEIPNEDKSKQELIDAHYKKIKAAKRLLALKRARSNLLDFTKLTLPDPDDPDDVDKSRYVPAKHHEVIAAALEEIEKGSIQRLIITMPPRHGKSELASRRFPAWFMGKDPYRHTIFATYNEDTAKDFGRAVREIVQSNVYKQLFPTSKLRKGSASAEQLQTVEGGQAMFVGRGGSLTGRGADLLVIDDPIKDREEAESKSTRDKMWAWFTDVAMSRLMSVGARVVIIMTRWHEDDLIGRLTDPKNPFYNEEEAKHWKLLSLPALADDDDPMGRKPGEALWPERFDETFLKRAQSLNPRGFASLYQGKPAPEDGDFFKKDWIKMYNPSELPQNLTIYVASDHAVSTDQDRDATCMIPVGVDENDDIWILPDVWWRRAQTDDAVEAMIDIMERLKPMMWWAEKGHISKSIGPFLRKRMQERGTYSAIDEVTPAKDKQTRAQAIRGRMAMGKVHFPRFAPWMQDAEQELLKFPSAKHDDFVDALAYIGLGLSKQISGRIPEKPSADKYAVGTMGWLKLSAEYERRKQKLLRFGGF